MGSQLERYLPHRDPFLFVDDVTVLRGGQLFVGHRVFRDGDFFFAGHFPGNPVVPGVILLEAMAQCGGAGLVKAGTFPEGSGFALMSFERARFHRPVRPGEQVDFDIEVEKTRRSVVRLGMRCSVDGELAAEATCTSMVVPPAKGAASGGAV